MQQDRQSPQTPSHHTLSHTNTKTDTPGTIPSRTAMMAMMDRAQPDEGYSEENGSHLSDTEMSYFAEADEADDRKVRKILALIMTLPVRKRKDLVHALIPTLPNNLKEELRVLIDHLTHFDPANYLPAELLLTIFSYLSPADLLTASRVSRAWRPRALDERLWRLCFAREGWALDHSKVESFERLADKSGRKVAESLLRSPGGAKMERKGSRKRARDEAFSEAENARKMSQDGPSHLDGTRDGHSEGMEGVEATSTLGSSEPESSQPRHPADFNAAPTIFQPSSELAKISWPYLYKQRRRLEANWESGAYQMFQLPHPDHVYEGHQECVYTVQHTNRHLVSGSRDRSIRIWDLATCRLKGEPLVGHSASVLCLQFDERPEHDIIVSGGSDAYVVVWKFSTGEILKKIPQDDSVLNLRFDDRYIVTCGKDKMIKVWTRHALAKDSPLIPRHVVSHFASEPGRLIAEFSLLTTLRGHQAAVNAVMIHENTIVSVSGDRTIKSWDLETGEFQKNYIGHTKGIACVQFDGRRIVSGSSDATIRIFDAERQAEIACLTGHSSLVRTVQAQFGDLSTTTAEELAEEARRADLGFFRALADGMQPARVSRRGTGRNAGSSRPEDILALGTKIPPGGGGSRWAKIVSGGYDESVILWKRDAEGKWCPKLTLKQDALQQRNRRRIALAQAQQQQQQAAAAAAAANDDTDASSSVTAQQQAVVHQHIATAQGYLAHATSLLQQHQQQQQAASSAPATSQMAAMASVQSALNQTHTQLQIAAPPTTNTAPAPASTSNTTTTTAAPQPATTAPAPAAQQQQQQPANPPPAQAAVAAAAGAGGGPPAPAHRESNRVFKLQFDARRIVCCSQNKTIVGWDFANGDPELERVGEWSLETA